MIKLEARKILFTFPENWSLEEALNRLAFLKADALNYDVINHRVVVLATKASKMAALIGPFDKDHIKYETTRSPTFRIPTLTNPPLNNTRSSEQQQQQQQQEPAEIHPVEIHSHTEFNTLLQSINSLTDENQNLRGLLGELQRRIQDLESQLKRKPILQDVQLPVVSIPPQEQRLSSPSRPAGGSQPMAIEREYSYIYY